MSAPDPDAATVRVQRQARIAELAADFMLVDRARATRVAGQLRAGGPGIPADVLEDRLDLEPDTVRSLAELAQLWPVRERPPSLDVLSEALDSVVGAVRRVRAELPPRETLPGETVDPLVGRILSGRYLVEARLGQGGMGAVYRARHVELGRAVAVKVLLPQLVGDPSLVARFAREARAAGRLAHPNLVAVHDVDVDDGVHYLAMEYVPGESLADALQRCGRLSVARAVEVARQMARGLEAAHRGGIVHRDVKPANVMLSEHGEVKVADFGLACLGLGATRISATGQILGTPGYMAPEQVRAEPVTPATDVFALGVTLYRMLTGRDAFSGPSAPAVLLAIVGAEPPPPHAVAADVPLALSRAVMRMLAKDPAQRPASMRACLDALEAALPSVGPSAAPGPSAVTGGAPPRRSRRAVAALLVGAALLAVGVGLFLGGGGRGAPRAADRGSPTPVGRPAAPPARPADPAARAPGPARWVYDDAERPALLARRWPAGTAYVSDGAGGHAVRLRFDAGRLSDWGDWGPHWVLATPAPAADVDVSGYRYLSLRYQADQAMSFQLILVHTTARGAHPEPFCSYAAYLRAAPGAWRTVALELARLELQVEGPAAYARAGSPAHPARLTTLWWVTKQAHGAARMRVDDLVFHRDLPPALAPHVQTD